MDRIILSTCSFLCYKECLEPLIWSITMNVRSGFLPSIQAVLYFILSGFGGIPTISTRVPCSVPKNKRERCQIKSEAQVPFIIILFCFVFNKSVIWNHSDWQDIKQKGIKNSAELIKLMTNAYYARGNTEKYSTS